MTIIPLYCCRRGERVWLSDDDLSPDMSTAAIVRGWARVTSLRILGDYRIAMEQGTGIRTMLHVGELVWVER